MVLVNLCHSHLHTKVKCDKPSNDDYDVNNLLLDNDRGFLVYSCIKPPINIDFEFSSNVKLSHIKIWPSVGAQKSTSFKISVKTNNGNHGVGVNPSYYQISGGDLAKTDGGIIFCRSESANELIGTNNNFIVKHINNNLKIINNVNNLRLTITRTENSVAALKRIEIWGHISCNKLPKFWFKSNKYPLQNDVVCQKTSSQNNEVEEKSNTSLKTLKEIPEEYLDPITFTIMVQPIILPSGKVIDFNTLEKFGENEALWGRPLSDPFTGIPFSDNYKPLFADSIKSQIDKFITENSNLQEFQKIPRVLGPHGVSNAAIHQHRSEILKLPHIYKTAKYSAIPLKASYLKSSVNKHSEESRLKHKMPINVNKFKSLFTERRKKLNTRRLHVTNILKNNLLTTNDIKDNSTIVSNSTHSNIFNQDLNQIKETEVINVTNTNIDENLQKNLNSILFSLKNFSEIKTSESNSSLDGT